MSGGHFGYKQYKIRDIADSIDAYVNGVELDEDDIKSYEHDYAREWISKEDLDYVKTHHRTMPNEYEYSHETIEELKKGYELLRIAEIYAQRIDWLLSGNDGEESFHKRLREDLDKLREDLK